ncbi:MAG: hypothetical protein IPM77_05250 [Crocinitomicaceae bacterium]|nr:hypothetical protein [Crocinitomicaceae bacterium]
MVKKSVVQLLFGLIALILMACTCNQQHIYYSPVTQNVPMISEKGEFNLEGGYHVAGIDLNESENDYFCNEKNTRGGYFTGAYSPKNSLGLTLNLFYVGLSDSGNGEYGTAEGTGKAIIIEPGAGYYKTLGSFYNWGDSKPLFNKIIFEAYGGLGFCQQKHTYFGDIKANSSQTAFSSYIQPAFGIKLNWLTLALSLKLNGFYFTDVNHTDVSNYTGVYQTYVDNELETLTAINNQPFNCFAEPAITLKIGWKKFKLSLQYCASAQLSGGLRYSSSEQERVTIELA